jgi:hypothetical protein
MKATNKPTVELFLFGLITAFFLGALSQEFAVGFGIASFYLFFQFLPFLPWVTSIDEGTLIKYIIITIMGYFFNPMLYYFLNLFGVPINIPSMAFISISTFLSGIIYNKKTILES